jgi:hypothetical protein
MTPLHQRERPRNKLLRCERNDRYVVGAAFERLAAKFRNKSSSAAIRHRGAFVVVSMEG